MKPPDSNYLNFGTRLTVTYALLVVLILGGYGLIIWQFNLARTQADRLASANQQLIVVLQLQVSLLSFHQRLDELARSRDPQRIAAEAGPLRRAIYEQTKRTRSALAILPPETRLDPALWPTLEVIEILLPGQLDAIAKLARTGDWAAVELRLGNQLKPIETQMATLVDSVRQQANGEFMLCVEQMRTVQRGILILVPATAICSFLIAAFFGWSIARRIIELRWEARVTERMRIARDLHDTLLQSFQGVLMKFSAVTFMIPDRPVEAQKLLETAVEQARHAITEGRDAVQGLRFSTVADSDLATAISTVGEKLAAHQADRNSPEFRVVVEGKSRGLAPLIRDEVYRIACEALRNAFRHAQAGRIDVEIRYDQRQLRLRVEDNGRGIDPKVLGEGGLAGHHGLAGMRERAKLVGGKLTLFSRPDLGTEVELTIPASPAYAKSPIARRSVFFGRRKLMKP
jgi:signal transduction histidine kinase